MGVCNRCPKEVSIMTSLWNPDYGTVCWGCFLEIDREWKVENKREQEEQELEAERISLVPKHSE